MARLNPLFPQGKQKITASEPVEAALIASPINGKPLKRVTCAGIEALYDAESRVVFPVKR